MSKPRSKQPASGSRPVRRSLVELTAMAASAAPDELLVTKPRPAGVSPEQTPAKDAVSPQKAAASDAGDIQPPASVDLTAEMAMPPARQNSKPMALGAAVDYRAEVFEMMKTTIKATLEYAQQLVDAKTPSQFVELSSTHARKQLELIVKQTRELRSLSRPPTRPDAK